MYIDTHNYTDYSLHNDIGFLPIGLIRGLRFVGPWSFLAGYKM